MGRYYSGDIEGKFFFAVQSSDDASFFGVEPGEPSYLSYSFDEDNLEDIEEGIETCIKEIGGEEVVEKIDNFFEESSMYSNTDIQKLLGVSESETKEVLEWYARLVLGRKIYNCVKEKGDCYFDAEL